MSFMTRRSAWRVAMMEAKPPFEEPSDLPQRGQNRHGSHPAGCDLRLVNPDYCRLCMGGGHLGKLSMLTLFGAMTVVRVVVNFLFIRGKAEKRGEGRQDK